MKNFLLIALISCLLFSCKTDQKKGTSSASEKKELANQKFADLDPISDEAMIKLYNEATYIDYIFHNLPFSVSQDDKPSIHSNLKLISGNKLGGISADCKPMGREFFHIGGVIAYEADIYFEDGCYGYVFLDKEKPIFANKVTEKGMKFYSNLVNQAQKIQNNAVQGG